MKPFRERNPVIIGALGLVVIALLLVGAFKAKQLPFIGGGDSYYVSVDEAGGLKAGDEVRIAGVRVGEIEKIELDGDHVQIQFRVKTDEKIGDETQAAIKVKTLLGDMYLAVTPAGDDELADGDELPQEAVAPFNVVDAFEGLANTSADIDTDQLTKSLTTLANLTRNTPEEFRGALQGVSQLSANLADRDEQIGSLLTNLERVATVLDDRDDDIIGLMDDSDVLFKALVKRRDAIHDLLVATSDLSTELTTLVRQSRADLKPALTHLDNVLDVLNKNEENLDNSLRLLEPFYRVFANTLGSGPWFDTFIQNLPPLPNIGLPTGSGQ